MELEEKVAALKKDVLKEQSEEQKQKVIRLKEIEKYLADYKNERLETVKEEIEKMTKTSYKQHDELAELNEEYHKKMVALQEKEYKVETDRRSVDLLEQQVALLQEQIARFTDVEAENHRLSMKLAQSDSSF